MSVWNILGRATGTWRTIAVLRKPGGATNYACVHALLGGLKLADPGVTTEPRGFAETTFDEF